MARTNAAVAASLIGPPAAPAIKLLTDCLRSSNAELRKSASDALGAIGAEAAAPTVEAMRNAEEDATREAAINALKLIGRPSLDPLVAALKDKSWSPRFWACIALGRVGLPEPKVVEALQEASRDTDGNISGYAMRALRELGV